MGADIHLVTQVRQPDGTWQDAEPFWPCGPCRSTGTYNPERPGQCPWCDGKGTRNDYDDRYYAVFAILADVRNREDVKPLAEPRGLPADFEVVNDGGHIEHDGKWMGDHSHSWFTLAELLTVEEWPEGASFASGFMPALAKLGAPGDVRIVFGFDN